MKKIILSVILFVCVITILSGCLITEDYDEYERKQFRSADEVAEIIASDISTDYKIQVSDTNEIIVEYSDSADESWYDISVAGGVLKIEKTRNTVGVEDNSVVITLPKREYQSIGVETSNGDIDFENTLCDKYKCTVKNGDITGILDGSKNDYLIVIEVTNGDSSLKNNVVDSSKIVEFNVENGDVNVGFSR